MRKQLMWLMLDAAGCGMVFTYALWTALVGWHVVSLGLMVAGVIVAVVLHRQYQSMARVMDAHDRVWLFIKASGRCHQCGHAAHSGACGPKHPALVRYG